MKSKRYQNTCCKVKRNVFRVEGSIVEQGLDINGYGGAFHVCNIHACPLYVVVSRRIPRYMDVVLYPVTLLHANRDISKSDCCKSRCNEHR